ncbi:hypothetical protein Tco_0316578 [Tanacetum coccineum]
MDFHCNTTYNIEGPFLPSAQTYTLYNLNPFFPPITPVHPSLSLPRLLFTSLQKHHHFTKPHPTWPLEHLGNPESFYWTRKEDKRLMDKIKRLGDQDHSMAEINFEDLSHTANTSSLCTHRRSTQNAHPTHDKTFKQLKEERLGWEAAQRLQAQELAYFEKQRAESLMQDANLARQGVSRLEMTEDQRNRTARARMVALVNTRRKELAEQRAQERRERPMTPSQLRQYMRTYVKNQGPAVYSTG